MNRIPPISLYLVLLLSLALSPLSAQITDRPVQLCGTTQFADTVIIDATVREGGRLVIGSRWVQDAPNLYTLLGTGTFVRSPTPPLDHFLGRFHIVNDSLSFDENPTCIAKKVDIGDDNPSIPSYVGTAVLFCTGGPNFPFQVTLNMILLNCSDTGFPGAASAQASQERIAAGDASNNEYQVK